jgi:EAL domain-containing protein (putative c-di-GMP-specific phosphodiesterase class I)
MQWVYRLHDALNSDRLALYYQTVRPLGNKETVGKPGYHEILVRVLDESGVPITPVNFIPAAERYHLMPAVDRWVIHKAFSILAARERWDGEEVFAINVSGQSLGEQDFLSFISDCLDSSGVPAQHICFEITETAAIANLWSAQRLISVLRHRGCTFSLDDFGTGLSSFGYLKRLAVDFLKIDGRFIKHIVDDPIDCAMVKSINQLSHVVGIRTIAESVETPEVLARLAELGVDYAQGNSVAGVIPLESER